MPVNFGVGAQKLIPFDSEVAGIFRALYITDKNGIEHKIESSEDLEAILAQMTPEELATWKNRMRFTPIHNETGIEDYTGTGRDIGIR